MGEVVIVMGPQGSGKGTQSQILAKNLGGVALSSGALLRATKNPGILARIDDGNLARSEDVQQIMADAIVAQSPDTPIVIDAFPRLLNEAKWLEEFLARNDRSIKRVIELVVPREESIQRLVPRAKIEGREDDTLESITKRLDTFEAETSQVLDYWRSLGLLVRVDGVGTVEEVAHRIAEALA